MSAREKLRQLRKELSSILDRFGVYLPGALVVLMAILFFLPEKSMELQYDRIGILSGQLWRFYTFSFTHWNMDHFIWDVAAFSIITYLCWEKSRKVFWWIMALGPLAVSLSLWLFFIDLHVYRGIGGVTSGLVAALSIFYLRDSSRRMNFMGLGIILAILGKLMIELHSGRSLMAIHDELTAIIMVHVAGATLGLLVTTLSFLRKPIQEENHGK